MNIIIDFIQNGDLLGLFIKLFGIACGIIYLFYAGVVIGQVRNLKKTVTINDDGILSALAYIQLILAAVLTIFALFIL